MSNKNILSVFMVFLFFLVITGCQGRYNQQRKITVIEPQNTVNSFISPETTSRIVISSTPAFFFTSSPKIQSTISITPSLTQKINTLTQTVTMTPKPTLNSEESNKKIEELIKTNGGCRLPCWINAVPGKTAWSTYSHFLESVTNIDSHEYPLKDHQYPQSTIQVKAVFPYFAYFVIDDFIKQVHVDISATQNFRLPKLLSDFGIPDEITLRSGVYYESREPFSQLKVYYHNKGIMAYYCSRPNLLKGGKWEMCLSETNPELYLWPPEEDIFGFFEESIEEKIGTSNIFLSINESTEMDIQQFFELFAMNSKSCFITPTALWDDQ